MAYVASGLPDRVLLEDLNDCLEVWISRKAITPVDTWGVPLARSLRAASSVQNLF